MMVRMVNKLLAKLGTWRLTLASDDRVWEFTLEELEGLPSREVTAGKHTYNGVALWTFLTSNGIDLATVQSLSAVASDGAGVPYDSSDLDEESPLLAWEQDGSLLPPELGTVALLHQKEIEVKQLERIVVASDAGQ